MLQSRHEDSCSWHAAPFYLKWILSAFLIIGKLSWTEHISLEDYQNKSLHSWVTVHLTHFYVWLMSTTKIFYQRLRGGPGGGVFLWTTVDLDIQRVFCNWGCLIGFWTWLMFKERFSTANLHQSHNDIVNICDNEVMIFGLESAQKLCAKCSRLISFPPLTDLEPLSFIVCRKVHYIEYRFFSKVIYQGKSCF